MTDSDMPYFEGTADDMRLHIARHAYAAQERFGQITDRMTRGTKLTNAGREAHQLAHHAAGYGWATVSLLGFIRDKFGAAAYHEAAAMVDDMMTNGESPHAEDIPYPPTTPEQAGANA